MSAVGWDWPAAARHAGVSAEGKFNAGNAPLPAQALLWCRRDGTVEEFGADDMEQRVGQVAAVLAELGVTSGDRVAAMFGRRPESFIAALAVWRLGGIYVPLFSGFGGQALRARLGDCSPTLVLTDAANRPSLEDELGHVGNPRVVLVDGDDTGSSLSLPRLLETNRSVPQSADTHLDDTAIIMYTSGTTGRPKGCTIPHRATISLAPYVTYCLEVAEGDVLFSGADAGWSFGLLTTGLAPMVAGATRVIFEGPFSPEAWWQAITNLDATHVAAAPTAYRQMMAAGETILPVRMPVLASAGEPLDGTTYDWFQQVAHTDVLDSYGLSELGMVIANGRHCSGPRRGAMGAALPGFDIRLVGDDGTPVPSGETGRIAVRDNGFLLSSGYWGRQDEWRARFIGDWFVTEDIARVDSDGIFHYVGRSDDVIVASGYNVGPAEVEAALISNALVADAACVGEYDPGRGQIVVAAFVVPSDKAHTGGDLLDELRPWVGERIGWHAAPRRVHVVDVLPRTDSGKVQRHLLRERLQSHHSPTFGTA